MLCSCAGGKVLMCGTSNLAAKQCHIPVLFCWKIKPSGETTNKHKEAAASQAAGMFIFDVCREKSPLSSYLCLWLMKFKLFPMQNNFFLKSSSVFLDSSGATCWITAQTLTSREFFEQFNLFWEQQGPPPPPTSFSQVVVAPSLMLATSYL